MEARKGRTRWTCAEFQRLPRCGSTRYEVIDGDVVVTRASTSEHQRRVGELLMWLGWFVKEHDLGRVYPGPIDVLFAEGDYMEPDLLFIRSDHLDRVSDRGIEGPPDLIVEVASPSTAGRDRGVKRDRYRHFGVAEYWVVDPVGRTIDVWRLSEDAEEAQVFGIEDRLEWRPASEGPTLRLDVGAVFAEG